MIPFLIFLHTQRLVAIRCKFGIRDLLERTNPKPATSFDVPLKHTPCHAKSILHCMTKKQIHLSNTTTFTPKMAQKGMNHAVHSSNCQLGFSKILEPICENFAETCEADSAPLLATICSGRPFTYIRGSVKSTIFDS